MRTAPPPQQGMEDGGGNSSNNGAASKETGTTTVVESPQQAMMPKKPKERKKKSESSDEQPTGGANLSGCAASEGDGGKEKQDANKKDRLVWTPKLHGKFVRACNELGVKDAVPMKILRRMKISGVTRAQVASHLQKYRENLSKQKDEETSGNRDRGDGTTVMVVHHTRPPSPPATATAPDQPAMPSSVPPSPRSPLETSTTCQPLNGHSSDHAVAAANLLLPQQQQLQLLLLPPVQHQPCFPPPPLLHQVGVVTITGEQPSRMMQQQAAAAAASEHGPTLVGVEQAAGAPVPPASGAENGGCPAEQHVQPSQAVDMLRAFPMADMRLEETETRMVQALVDAGGEKGQRPEEAAVAGSLSPPCSIIERYWGSGDRPSWDLFGLRPISADAAVPTGISTLKIKEQ